MIAHNIVSIFLSFVSGFLFCLCLWEREGQRKSIFYLVMAILFLLFSIALAAGLKIRIWF